MTVLSEECGCSISRSTVPTAGALFSGVAAIHHLPEVIRAINPDRVALITDMLTPRELLGEVMLAMSDVPVVTFSASSQRGAIKSMTALELMLDQLWPDLTRDSVIVAVGGGEVANLAGMASGLLYRGVRLVHVPTTLLSQADATIGSKQAVNSRSSKNAYGLYHSPVATVSDHRFLDTLATEALHDGLAEICKLGLAVSRDLVRRCEVVWPLAAAPADFGLRELGLMAAEAARVKFESLESDHREVGSLRFHELGHVMAHGLEAASNFGISHGRAVAIGIVAETHYAYAAGLASKGTYEYCRDLFVRSLQYKIPSIQPDLLLRSLQSSNKRTRNGIELALLRAPQVTFIHYVSDPEKLVDSWRYVMDESE